MKSLSMLTLAILLAAAGCQTPPDDFPDLKLPYEFRVLKEKLPEAIRHPLFPDPVLPIGKVAVSDSVQMLVTTHQPGTGIPWSEITGYFVFEDSIFHSIVLANDFSQSQNSSKLYPDLSLAIFSTVLDPDTGAEIEDSLTLFLPREIEQNLKAI